MAASNPGSTCSTKYAGLDAGTNARICMPTPGYSNRETLYKKSAVRRVPGLSAPDGDQAILDAQKMAIDLLDQRRKDVDLWNEDTQESFLTWFGTDEARARDLVRRLIVKAIAKLTLKIKNFVPDQPPRKLGTTAAQYRDALDSHNREFAYVNPDRRGGKYEMIVHLGPEFATADATTRAGTLIHEVSHFFTVGQTDDVESAFLGMQVEKRGDKTVTMYGYARAERLSMQSQKNALRNADNFEFFVERQDPRDHFDTEALGDFPQGSDHGA